MNLHSRFSEQIAKDVFLYKNERDVFHSYINDVADATPENNAYPRETAIKSLLAMMVHRSANNGFVEAHSSTVVILSTI